MTAPKTKPTNQSAEDFLNTVEPEEKKLDSFSLLELFTKITKEKPVMWGPSIVGFGRYHFKSARSSQEGDWPLVGFSPRKQSLTLYLMADFKGREDLLRNLGKHKTSKACLYIKRLSDVKMTILAEIVKSAYQHTKRLLTPQR